MQLLKNYKRAQVTSVKIIHTSYRKPQRRTASWCNGVNLERLQVRGVPEKDGERPGVTPSGRGAPSADGLQTFMASVL